MGYTRKRKKEWGVIVDYPPHTLIIKNFLKKNPKKIFLSQKLFVTLPKIK